MYNKLIICIISDYCVSLKNHEHLYISNITNDTTLTSKVFRYFLKWIDMMFTLLTLSYE